jgi:hypothetical protein
MKNLRSILIANSTNDAKSLHKLLALSIRADNVFINLRTLYKPKIAVRRFSTSNIFKFLRLCIDKNYVEKIMFNHTEI